MGKNKLIFLTQKQRYLQFFCVVSITCLAACGNNDYSDLTQYIEEVKAVPKGNIKPLSKIQPIESFVFNPEGLRDPFKPLAQPVKHDEVPETPTGDGLKPDTKRHKDELESYPLTSLKMVGSVIMKSLLWGLVKADDGSIHRVQPGNYMGKNYGKITHISTDKIELLEIVPDKPGSWREQQNSLALTDDLENKK
ncbi:MAG: pilus assembly protein PilP [Methylococcales bacterium]|nr:pilus assembly protein PilP [Methylococcales bacterium]